MIPAVQRLCRGSTTVTMRNIPRVVVGIGYSSKSIFCDESGKLTEEANNLKIEFVLTAR